MINRVLCTCGYFLGITGSSQEYLAAWSWEMITHLYTIVKLTLRRYLNHPFQLTRGLLMCKAFELLCNCEASFPIRNSIKNSLMNFS